VSKIRLKLPLFILLFVISALISAAKPYSVRMADSEMKRNHESWMIDFSKKLKWDYSNGLELQSIYKVWE
jgi:unsaturated rhamnogalacturonyl hydrolase